MSAIGLREGPYHYGSEDHRKTRQCGGKQFTLIVSSAYNAFGLIGSEQNGIVILNDTDRQVVLDRECEQSTGYFGPSRSQLEQFKRLLEMDDGPFLNFCSSHHRFRPNSLGELVARPPSQPFSWDTDCGYNPDAKAEFHQRAKHQLRLLAKELGFEKDEYDLRSNQGGVAVSGEITLHHDRVYVQVAQSVMGGDRGVLFRSCIDRKDYTGGPNNFASLRELDNPRLLADKVRRVMRVSA